MRASACSVSSRLLVRPSARSRARLLTSTRPHWVQSGAQYSACWQTLGRNVLFRRQLFLCRGKAAQHSCARTATPTCRAWRRIMPALRARLARRRSLRPLPHAAARLRRDACRARLRISGRRAGAGAQIPRRAGARALPGRSCSAACISTGKADCVVPVPLSRPSACAAALQPVARDRAPRRAPRRARLAPELCERSARHARRRWTCRWKSARRNVRGAFHCPRHRSAAPPVAVLDDVHDHRRNAGRDRRHAQARRRRARGELGRRADIRHAACFDIVLRPAGNPAQRGQRDPPRRQHRRAPAPGRAARLFAWTTGSSSAPGSTTTSTRSVRVHADWDSCLKEVEPRSHLRA